MSDFKIGKKVPVSNKDVTLLTSDQNSDLEDGVLKLAKCISHERLRATNIVRLLSVTSSESRNLYFKYAYASYKTQKSGSADDKTPEVPIY